MKYTKLSAAAALAAGSALILSACAPGGGNAGDSSSSGSGASQGGDSGAGNVIEGDKGQKLTAEASGPGKADLGDVKTQDGSIAYSVGADDFLSYNGLQSNTYTTYNSAVADRMFSSFWYFGTDGSIIPDKDFRTYEKTSDDPLTVKYTISDDAKWSDGTPVTAGDFIVHWAANNDTIKAEGAETPLFDSISFEQGKYIPEAPEGEADGKEFTVTYPEPYADWEILISTALPAHVVAKEAGMSFEELVTAAKEKDVEALTPAAEFWNDGWDFSPGELPDASLVPSMGPYKFKDGGWQAGQSITLEANPEYGGAPAATKELVLRFADPKTHVQALQNGDLDVIEPQATVDTLQQLEGLGDDVNVQTGDQLTWEHVDYNRGEGSVFADSPELREAFALCLPRQQIVDNLIKPIYADAQVMNLREVFPFQDKYQEVVDAAYPKEMDQPNIEKAKELVEKSGVSKPTVRLGYQAGNQRRTETVALIKSSCDQAGFDVQDANSPVFFKEVMPAGDYDAALYAWAGSGQKASGANIYQSDGAQNQQSYNNPEVDAAWDKLATSLDENEQLEQTKTIEKLLWEDFQAIPLYAHPGLVGHKADVANVRDTAAQSGALWNVEQWVRVQE
ncbi:ABC transporter family substrate-binding protein [Micrococcus luteus]|jgi:peptide/nickel transport system substrate-binding protein|uniref:ABC transporter family substrate-binding protein n=1 Tax=Micrococcus luteus TaxID=1270 RepID=UPI0001C39686|nr:ABC transporter family substrate-binding protein [Micrococcus luteus]KAB1903392.1 ABC transporter family substrate-binding protein [Micrococcus luteus NCTC 2665]QCY45092.1 ABC transporter family substrate-binding protein [Micrococcus luteus]RFP72812.1 ABC transporter family substrate-binding protein [Micrococcus luteus]HAN85088.1 ABC transporter family substrate-binding protein [Micrococcus luteus]HCG14748.1 ABC transporter family substrate-binding protein [Micrococcus luteus]